MAKPAGNTIPVLINNNIVRLSECLVGDRYMVRVKHTGSDCEMVLNTGISKVLSWHNTYSKDDTRKYFSELSEAEVNFLETGNIYGAK